MRGSIYERNQTDPPGLFTLGHVRRQPGDHGLRRGLFGQVGAGHVADLEPALRHQPVHAVYHRQRDDFHAFGADRAADSDFASELSAHSAGAAAGRDRLWLFDGFRDVDTAGGILHELSRAVAALRRRHSAGRLRGQRRGRIQGHGARRRRLYPGGLHGQPENSLQPDEGDLRRLPRRAVDCGFADFHRQNRRDPRRDRRGDDLRRPVDQRVLKTLASSGGARESGRNESLIVFIYGII